MAAMRTGTKLEEEGGRRKKINNRLLARNENKRLFTIG
jgi:hypothetical protein